MKIGIISINMYSKGLNFACPLHTYAFQQFLLKNGIESTVINYKPVYYNNFDLKHPYDYYKKQLESAEKKAARTPEERREKELKTENLRLKCDNYKALYKEREIRYDKFQKFIENNYIKTDVCYDSDLLEVMDPGFDCYICATDVIWKYEPGFGFDRGFFLGSTCMENKWKIAYAGSQNARKARSKEEDQQFFRYLEDFDRISVREDSLKKLINKKSSQKAELVVDPVLLHEKDFYEKIMIKPQEDHYLLLYYVVEKAQDTLDQAVKYAKAHGLKIIELTEQPEKAGRLQGYEDVEVIYRYDVGIEEWLGYIQYADCIFTNSFHACCFCALFEKKFFVGRRRGDKVDNILKMLGLSDRRFNAKSDLINHEPPETDYKEVRKRLAEWRECSGKFILDAIHDLEGKQREPKDYESSKKRLTYRVLYNSGKAADFTWRYTGKDGIMKKMASGSFEYQSEQENAVNNGNTRLKKNEFCLPGYEFLGWKIRFRIDNRWFYYLDDDTVCLKSKYKKGKDVPIKIFKDEAVIPYIPVNHISVMAADAVWRRSQETPEMVCRTEKNDREMPEIRYAEEKNERASWWKKASGSILKAILKLERRQRNLKMIDTYQKRLTYPVVYNSGRADDDFTWRYTGEDGLIEKLSSEFWGYQTEKKYNVNNGETRLKKNQFSLPGYEFAGWRIRLRIYNRWFYYLEDNTICQIDKYKKEANASIKIFGDETFIPYIPVNRISMMEAEAVWKKTE